MQRLLLVQTAFLGDVILTTPMIAFIKRNFPDCSLSVLTTPAAASLLTSNPDIDEVITIQKKGKKPGISATLKLVGSIRERRFDILLAPHQSHRTTLIALLSGIPLRIGYRSAGFARIGYHRLLSRPMERSEIERLVQFAAEALELPEEKEPHYPQLYETHESTAQARELLEKLSVNSPPFLLAVSSVWPTKRWTAEGFATLTRLLIEKYERHVLLIGSPADREVAVTVESHFKSLPGASNDRLHNICGQTNLLGLYSLMKNSRLLVSNDSAPIHIGCAARLPLVALFGPTIPAFGYAPTTPESRIAQIEGLNCRPCGIHGGIRCPEKHFDCMRQLTPEMVMAKIEELIG